MSDIEYKKMMDLLEKISPILKDCKDNEKDGLPELDVKIARLLLMMESTGVVEMLEKLGGNIPIEEKEGKENGKKEGEGERKQ